MLIALIARDKAGIARDKAGTLQIRKDNRADHLAYTKRTGATEKREGPDTSEPSLHPTCYLLTTRV